jgi:hypothetical protein
MEVDEYAVHVSISIPEFRPFLPFLASIQVHLPILDDAE